MADKDIIGIHHIGLIVNDMDAALAVFRRLGFRVGTPAYPALPHAPGGVPEPVGAGNTHADFPRSFIELLALAPERRDHLPADAALVPLSVPDDQLAVTRAVITRTVANLAARLDVAEGAHILVFATRDADETAARLDANGIGHTGARAAQRPVATADGTVLAPIRFLDINGDGAPPGMVPEGRVGVAEDASPELLDAQMGLEHPNGSLGVAEVVVCADEDSLGSIVDRYGRLLGVAAEVNGDTTVFDLGSSLVTITTSAGLAVRLPGETPHAVPGLSACVVAVADLSAAERYLRAQGVTIHRAADGRPFISARDAHGTAIILQSSSGE